MNTPGNTPYELIRELYFHAGLLNNGSMDLVNLKLTSFFSTIITLLNTIFFLIILFKYQQTLYNSGYITSKEDCKQMCKNSYPDLQYAHQYVSTYII